MINQRFPKIMILSIEKLIYEKVLRPGCAYTFVHAQRYTHTHTHAADKCSLSANPERPYFRSLKGKLRGMER